MLGECSQVRGGSQDRLGVSSVALRRSRHVVTLSCRSDVRAGRSKCAVRGWREWGTVMARRWCSSSPVVDELPLLEEPGARPGYLADLADGFGPEAFGSDAGERRPCWARSRTGRRGRGSWCRWPAVSQLSCTSTAARSARRRTTSFRILNWRQDLVLASDDEDRIGFLLPVLGDAAVPEQAVTAVVEALVAQRGRPRRGRRWPDTCFEGTPCGAPRTGGSTMINSAGSTTRSQPPQSALGDHPPLKQRAALEACLTGR